MSTLKIWLSYIVVFFSKKFKIGQPGWNLTLLSEVIENVPNQSASPKTNVKNGDGDSGKNVFYSKLLRMIIRLFTYNLMKMGLFWKWLVFADNYC